MQELLGSHNDNAAFAAFLADWRAILDVRVDAAVDRIGAVDGVAGVILAGSLGTGKPWPLSDIDLLPIYRDDRHDEAVPEVESCRLELLEKWSRQGWRSGLDIGRLRFTTGELARAFAWRAGSGHRAGRRALVSQHRQGIRQPRRLRDR